MFSLKTGTVMRSSKLGYQVWAIAIYQAAVNIKGISSLKLHRDLGITQKSAWHLMHRIRKAFEAKQLSPGGEVEQDSPLNFSTTQKESVRLFQGNLQLKRTTELMFP